MTQEDETNAEQESHQGDTTGSHHAGTRSGNEAPGTGEAGREEHENTGADRPAGGSTGRMSTGINSSAEDPIDPDSPHMPPP